jgi:hypothetical protein
MPPLLFWTPCGHEVARSPLPQAGEGTLHHLPHTNLN